MNIETSAVEFMLFVTETRQITIGYLKAELSRLGASFPKKAKKSEYALILFEELSKEAM